MDQKDREPEPEEAESTREEEEVMESAARRKSRHKYLSEQSRWYKK